MSRIKKHLNIFEFILIVFLISTLILTLYFYQYLPEQIPTHWNIKGEIDNYSNKSMIFITLLIPIVIFYAIPIFKKIDPKSKNYDRHEDTYNLFRYLITIFMLVIHNVVLFVASGYNISINNIMPLVVGVLFVIMGNYMARVKQNYFIGIKTPWTLDNEVVWNKTHRRGGYIFVLIGFTFIINSFLSFTFTFYITLGVTLIGILYLFIYSYVIHKKITSK